MIELKIPARKGAFDNGVNWIATKKVDIKGAFLGCEGESLPPFFPFFQDFSQSFCEVYRSGSFSYSPAEHNEGHIAEKYQI